MTFWRNWNSSTKGISWLARDRVTRAIGSRGLPFTREKGAVLLRRVPRRNRIRQRAARGTESNAGYNVTGDRTCAAEHAGVGTILTGVVKKKFTDQRQYGFIHAVDGDYFFHLTDLDPALWYEDVREGMEVDFDIARRPAAGKNGNAQNVRYHNS